jgi:hypothetical protein
MTVDGKAPGENHGVDIDAYGNGTVAAAKLYQFVRQAGDVRVRTFEIRLPDPGVQAFAVTFDLHSLFAKVFTATSSSKGALSCIVPSFSQSH